MALTPPTGGQAAPTAVAPVAPPNTYAALYTVGPTGATGATGPQGPMGPGNATSPTILTANNAAELPLKIVGAASQSASLVEFRDSTNALLMSVGPSGSASSPTYLGGAGASAVLKGQVADGASAVGVVLDTTASLVTSGAKLLSVRNNGSEVFSVGPSGYSLFGSWLTVQDTGAGNGRFIVGQTGSFDSNAFMIRNKAGTKTFISVWASSPLVLSGDSYSGVGSLGVQIDTGRTFSAGDIVQFTNNGALKASIGYDGGIRAGGGLPLALSGNVADGGSAVGVVLDNSVNLVTAGAKLLSIRNNAVEKAYVSKDGYLYTGGMAVADTFSSLTATTLNVTGWAADGVASVAAVVASGNSFVTAGAKLLSVRNAGVEKAYVDKDGTFSNTWSTIGANISTSGSFNATGGSSGVLKGGQADGASAVGVVLDNGATLSTSGAKLLSVRNNTTEKSYVDKDGGIYSVASGGLKTGTNSGIRLQTCDEVLLADGPNVPFANSYAAVYNGDGTITYETWTDSGSSRLRRRLDYAYANALVSTIRTRVYSADDGTTVVGDMTETLTYSSGRLASSAVTRSV